MVYAPFVRGQKFSAADFFGPATVIESAAAEVGAELAGKAAVRTEAGIAVEKTVTGAAIKREIPADVARLASPARPLRAYIPEIASAVKSPTGKILATGVAGLAVGAGVSLPIAAYYRGQVNVVDAKEAAKHQQNLDTIDVGNAAAKNGVKADDLADLYKQGTAPNNSPGTAAPDSAQTFDSATKTILVGGVVLVAAVVAISMMK